MIMENGIYYFNHSDFKKVYVFKESISDDNIFDYDYDAFNECFIDYIYSGDLVESNIGSIKQGNFIFLIDYDNNIINDGTNAYFFIMLDDAYTDNNGIWTLKCW